MSAGDYAALALTIDVRAMILAAIEDRPQQLAELNAVLLSDHHWRRAAGLD